MLTINSQNALAILRMPSETFAWSILPIIFVIFYIYAVELKKQNWGTILSSLAFVGQDLLNEIINSLVLHFSKFAPIWGINGKTSLLLLVGLNIEIILTFIIVSIISVKLLPNDKYRKFFGINNRIFLAIIGSIISVAIESWLNYIGLLTWDYPWWNRQNPWLIVFFGYLPFYAVCFYVYDLPNNKKRMQVVGAQWLIVIIALFIFGWTLNWI